MARNYPAPLEHTLEHGSLSFFFRPRVEEQQPDESDDVQRLLFLFSPGGSPMERLIAIARERTRPPDGHDRLWGYVDLVLTPYDMQVALGAQVYGARHLRAARPFAGGAYELVFHDDHSHLRWSVDRVEDDAIARETGLGPSADFVVGICNPNPAAWGLDEFPELQSELFDELEVHVTIPAPFPPAMQRRFAGRTFVPLDSPAWLDHPGAELVFVMR